MQTFTVGLSLSVKAVITRDFLAESREEAQAPEATAFLQRAQELFPEDDDQFMLMVVTNAFRSSIRHSTLDFMSRSGVGGSVSPLTVTSTEVTMPKAYSETPPNPQERELKQGTVLLGQGAALAQLTGPGSTGTAVQHLIEARAE